METIEGFTEFLTQTGTPNLLSIGIVAVVIWLFISGLKKGWKKRSPEDGSEKDADP